MSKIFNESKQPVTKVVNNFPIMGLLGIIFVVAKITGHITWSWWLVTLPFWIGPAIVLGILAIVLVVFGIAFVGAWTVDILSGR